MKLNPLRPAAQFPALRRRRCNVPPGWWAARRSYAVQAPGTPTVQVFDQHVKYLQKERAAADPEESRNADYVRNEVAMRLVERLLDINRNFDRVLDLGANACNVAQALQRPIVDAAQPDMAPAPAAHKVGRLVCAEASAGLLWRDAEDQQADANMAVERIATGAGSPEPLAAAVSGFAEESFDAVMSSLALHWANDLPGVLGRCRAVLKPDAPLLAAMLGGDSLFELRTSLQLANLERRGGLAQHTSPLADVRDVGGLLQRAGFRILTVDVDDIVVGYPSLTALLKDLQAMGESSALLGRESPIGRDVLLAAESIYRELHGEEVDGRASLPATFRVIYFIAWKEGLDQKQPLQRGSGQLSLKDVLEGGLKEEN